MTYPMMTEKIYSPKIQDLGSRIFKFMQIYGLNIPWGDYVSFERMVITYPH